MGVLLVSKIREEYLDRITETLSFILSLKVSDTVVEPYSVLISFRLLVDVADECILLDTRRCTTSSSALRR